MRREGEPDGSQADHPGDTATIGHAMSVEAVAPAPVTPRMTRRDAVLTTLAVSRSVHELAGMFGVTWSLMAALLADLLRQGRVVRVGYGRYLAAGAVGTPAPGASIPGRPQPIRDTILAYLSEPRRAVEVAGQIGRSVPNATGHLAAMGRLGLVVRTAYGRYGRADLVAHGARPAAIVRPHPVREAARACLDRRMHVAAVAAKIGRSVQSTTKALRQLAAMGLVVQLGEGVFAPPGHSVGLTGATAGAVRAARADAGACSSEQAQCSP